MVLRQLHINKSIKCVWEKENVFFVKFPKLKLAAVFQNQLLIHVCWHSNSIIVSAKQ